MMREKIALRRRTTPKQVTLPNVTAFTARYKRISRKKLLINIHVKNDKKIGPRKRKIKMYLGPAMLARKRVKFTPSSSTQDRVRRLKKKYANLRRQQTVNGLASNLAKVCLAMGSQAINSAIGKKIINKGIDSINF